MSAPKPAHEMSEYERIHRASIERMRNDNKIAAERDKIRVDPGCPFEDENLRWLAHLKRTNLPHYHSLRGFYKDAGISVWDLDKAVDQVAANGENGATRTISTIDFPSLPEIEPPPRQFVVGGWLPVPCLSSCYGGPGIGKSMIAQQLGTCVVSEHLFFGAAVKRTVVLGIFAEDDDDELKRRQWRINKAFGLRFADLAGLHIEGAVGLDNMLCDFPAGSARTGPLYDPLIAKARDLKAGLIILDNRAQMFLVNENDRTQATYSANLAAGIARSINGSVLLLGHDAKAAESEYSGSTAWDAVTRSRWWLHQVQNGNDQPDLLLERRKSNYAAPETVKLTWRDGVLWAADESHMTPDEVLALKLRQGAARQCFLDALDILTTRGRPTSDSVQATNYAPKFIVREGLAGDFTQHELEQATRDLFAEDRIVANALLFKGANRHVRYGLARKTLTL